MGIVEFPVKDSMFNSYRFEREGAMDGRVSPDTNWKAEVRTKYPNIGQTSRAR
jgi:hypothetical protein